MKTIAIIGSWNKWDEELPEKGRDIYVIDTDGEVFKYVFRCNCSNPNCKEIRSISGAMIIDPALWQYR